MGMGEQDIFDFLRRDGQIGADIVIFTLNHALIHQKVPPIPPFQQGPAPGDFMICAKKGQFHAYFSSFLLRKR